LRLLRSERKTHERTNCDRTRDQGPLGLQRSAFRSIWRPVQHHLDRPLLDRIKGGCPFSEIDERYWDLLILGLNTARSSRFSQNIDTCGPNGYVCVEWSVDDLLNSRVLPHFGLGLSYREFLTLLPTSAAPGTIDPADPRLKAWMTPLQPAFAQNEPLISIRIGADLMLIEGYARSLLWFRSPTKPLLIWQPVE
jgi:hypothetical protein